METKAYISKKMKIILLITIAIRVILQMMVPLWVQADFSYDDLLMVLYAEDITNFDWLGDYNHMTLNKYPGFGIFLAKTLTFWKVRDIIISTDV